MYRSENETSLFSDPNDLKEKYSSFYYRLRDYVKSLPNRGQWCFTQCIDFEREGSLFFVTYTNICNPGQILDITAQKTGSEYHFSSQVR